MLLLHCCAFPFPQTVNTRNDKQIGVRARVGDSPMEPELQPLVSPPSGAPRSRRPLLTFAALVLSGLAAVSAARLLRSGRSSSSSSGLGRAGTSGAAASSATTLAQRPSWSSSSPSVSTLGDDDAAARAESVDAPDAPVHSVQDGFDDETEHYIEVVIPMSRFLEETSVRAFLSSQGLSRESESWRLENYVPRKIVLQVSGRAIPQSATLVRFRVSGWRRLYTRPARPRWEDG